MDRRYADTVRLLLSVAPIVFEEPAFAMKGGTALNLFLHDLPRLSVDIDVVFVPWQAPRADALAAIAKGLDTIAAKLEQRGWGARPVAGNEGESKLLVEDPGHQVKIEVNTVFRGTVLPVESRPLVPAAAADFATEFSLPILAPDELYGGKLVAALDRQHPRDLFDVHVMFESGGLGDGAIECFVTYLAGHNRPIHEVLSSKDKDIGAEFRNQFSGMTRETVALESLLEARNRLRQELAARLNRPGFSRHLQALHYGNHGGVYERQAVFG
ncbi:nucleotidyl transferase AbiEii/AbiGii toxin family protein [Pseudoxanthomonas mexicana]